MRGGVMATVQERAATIEARIWSAHFTTAAERRDAEAVWREVDRLMRRSLRAVRYSELTGAPPSAAPAPDQARSAGRHGLRIVAPATGEVRDA